MLHQENLRDGIEGTIEENLEKMRSEMGELLLEESMGGNAGSVEIRGKKFPCAVANGACDTRTVKILAFGNIGDRVMRELRHSYDGERLGEFAFRAACNLDRKFQPYRIVNFFHGAVDWYSGELESTAITVLKRSVEEYNNQHGF